MAAVALQNVPNVPAARLLHLTDLHFWRVILNPLRLLNKRIIGNANLVLRRRRELLTRQAPGVLDYIASLRVRDVILTGDFTSTAAAPEFELARDFLRDLARRGMSPRILPGNHDVYTFESVRHRRFEKFLGEWLPAERLPATRPLSGGFPVVYVPTVCPNLLSSRGRIRLAELEALCAELAASSPGPLLVAGHYPLLNKTYGYVLTPGRRLRGASALAAVLREYKAPLLYFCGHVHRFSLVRDPLSPNLTHLSSGALFRRDHDARHTADFSEIRSGPAGFHVLRHRLATEWTVSEEIPRPAPA
jgi:3',5'-cyclic AMP phosphodiesterase CpdA